MSRTNISSDRIHGFNQATLALDRELGAEFEIDLLLMPEELRRNSIVAAQWHTMGDKQVCPLCASLDGQIFPVNSGEWGRIFPPIHLQCFLSNRTPIYTLDGWKKIGDIAVGDQVLTHKGRFRRVSRLFRSQKYRGKVITVTMDGSYKKFVVTPEHPFLTEDGWKKASDLRRRDKILILAIKCKRCRKPIPYYRKYCSYRCLSKDITDRQWSNPKHRKLMSVKASAQLKREYRFGIRDPHDITKAAHKKVKELVASKDPWGWQDPAKLAKALGSVNVGVRNKESSRRMKKNNPVYLPGAKERQSRFMKQLHKEHPEKHPNFILVQKGHKTGIEKKIGGLLEELGFQAIFNHRVDGYYIDWALPDLKIGIECDGAYWHQDKEKDLVRDKRIESFGWNLLHLEESEIKNDLDGCRRKIIRLAKNHSDNYEFIPLKIKTVRSRLLGRGRMLYNFAVEEDESYIAKGLVSHNCRCGLSYITSQERGVEARIRKYRPIDPELLKKWSSKIYTDAEIREMVKAQKAAKPIKVKPKKVEPISYEKTVDSESERILRSGLRTKNEHGVAIDAKGNIIMKRAGKSPDFLSLSPDDIEKIRVGKAKSLIHNHPGGASFSSGDIHFAGAMDLDELIAVGKKYKYIIKPKPGGIWPVKDTNELAKMWKSARQATQSKYDAIYRKSRGMLDWQELYAEQTHEIMEGMSKQLGLIYKRSKW